ncbi:MAG TPA: LamG-like jellyroll fold domain-containing protein [Blastocatellia bacterium]
MKSKYALLLTITVLSLSGLSFGVLLQSRGVGASALQQPQRTYTANADFAEGTLVGLEYTTVPNQLQVAVESGVLPFIWVPNSNEGTISKVDTSTGKELGRYRTAPSNTTPNPSRTTVDLQGNCWVGNRQTATAVKVGLLESGQCVDRNTNGTIETSRDLNNDGNIQGTELLAWGQDECVLTEVVLIAGQERNYVPGSFAGSYANDYWNPGPRGIAIDASGNVWVGTYGTKKYYYINGATGQIMRTIDVSSANHTPYGAVIDRNGILWSSGYDDNAANADLLRLNPADNSFLATNLGHQVYGIGLDRNNHLFVSAYHQQKLSRVNVLTGQKEWTRDGTGDDYQARGIAVTSDGDVWVANTGSGKVTRWSNDGVKKTAIAVGNSPTGVAVDAAGKVWVVNNGDDYIKRIDPATNTVDLEKHILGTTHYGYSDMTGFVSRTVTTRTGTWTVVYDSQTANAPWGVISWNSAEPAGTSIRARARSSANQTTWSEWEQAGKGVSLSATPAGRYLQIEVTLQISTGDVSPILYDLTVASGSGGGACNFVVTPTSQSFPATAGQGSINVTTATGCNWTALSGYSWITINSGATGTGSGTVGYTVAANTEASSRIGSLLVAGQFVVIAQSGAGLNCPVTPLAIPQTVTGSLVAGDCRSAIDAGAYGDLYSFTASAGQRVAITLGSTQFDAFLTLISPDGAIIAINDDNNSSVSTDSRIPPGSDYFVLPLGGTYIVEASSFNDNEVGSYTLSLTAPPGGQTCAYAITPASQAFTAAGGNGSATVTASAGCGWTAGSNVSWITIGAGSSGTGNGSVSYAVEANTSLGYRVGKLLIAGQVLSVIQAGTGGNCTITPLVIPQTVNASWAPGDCPSGSGSLTDLYSFSGQAGQQVAISLTTANTFTSLYLYVPNGLTIFAEGNGNLRIPSGSNFFVLPYTGTYIVEAGAAGAGNYTLSLTVPSVSTCTYAIAPASQPFAAAGGAGSVNVTVQAGCAWTAASNAAWITINSGASGNGNGTVNFTVAANTGAQRMGTLTIAGQTFTVTQAGTGGALTLVDHLTTAGPISTTSCSLPPPKANFASTEARVYHWFYVLNPQAGDLMRWEFVQPNGTIYNTSSRTNNFNGDTCAWAWIDIAGQPAATLPGAWQVRAYWNDALLTTDSFNILAVNNCPAVSGIAPANGAAGSAVTITGANFTGVTAVRFANNVAAQFTVNSDSQITATVPSGAVTGSIRISKANCADEQTATFTVSVIPGNCVTAPAGAIAWLPGDGNASDLTGMHNGTLQNGATATAAGKVGQAFSFDGANDFVGLGNFSAGAQWTLEAWVNPASVPTNRRAILGGMSDCNDWALVLENNQWGVAFKPSSGACTATASSGITAVAGTWYHLVATNDGTTARIYVNGELKGSGAVAAGATGTTAGAYVGGNVCCTEFFPGLVDEATIYSRALSLTEIQSVYNAGSAGKCKTTTSCTVKADYQLQNTLSSSVGTPPALTNLGSNTYGTATVDGASRTVLQFAKDDGVVLAPITGVISNQVYTAVVLFSFNEVSGYRRILDFKNNAEDGGLYNRDGFLVFFSGIAGANAVISPNTFVQVVLTRDSAKNVVGYVNGVQQFSFVDNGDAAVIDGNNRLIFFRDNANNESSAGSVARIRLYDCALTPGEVAGLDRVPGQTPICTTITGLNVNRLCNPDAELGPGATVKSQVVPIPGWTTTSNFTATRYDATGSLTVEEGQAIGGGTNYFYGGDTNASSTATQLVSVADEATGIDAGQRTAQLRAYLGGFGGDNAGVRAEFLNAGGTVLGTALLLGPRSDDMQLLSTTGQVPAGTRTIRVTMTSTRVGGDDNEGYFENLSVALTQSGGATCPTLSGISPSSGAVGSTVTITGANFTGVTAVKFASNVSAAFTINSDTQITATVPTGAVTGAITISKTGCNDVQTATFTVTVPPACPTVSGINPTSGAVGGSVMITGANFTGVTSVKFASNVSAAFTVHSDTQITATVPSGAVTGAITISKAGCNDVQTASFTVSTGPCITVAIATNLTGTSGGSLTVPIVASDTTGKGAISYDFTLSYDPAVLRLQATPFDRTGTLSAAMTVTTNTSVAGQLRLSAFGTNPLAGAGTLLNLKFDLIGAVSACSNLTWVSFRFNEGTPCATTTNGRACAVGGAISGAINYCISPKPVPGVTVAAAGSPPATTTTNNSGTYQLTGLGGGGYTVTPAKTGDVNGIASFDAALIAQHVVNIISLTSCQQLAGDTSNNGELSSFDAALIAQYVVGINNPASIAGTWKFVPPSRSYASLSGDQINQNFDAVLMGDVSGNWVAGAALAEAAAPLDEWLSQQAVQVSLPSLVAGSGTSLILPVTAGDLTGRGILAYDFDLIYDANLLQAQVQPVDATDTLSSNFTVTPNATPGRLRVSGFGAMPLSGSGVLLKLRFNVIGTVGNNTALTWQKFQFNEGNPAASAVNGHVTVINIYTLSLTPSSQTIALGGSGALTLVSSVAQPVAVTYPLTSSNPAVASVPATVTIPANTTMATVAVTPNAVGGPVTITAGFGPLPGAPIATATVTVIRPVTSVSAASFLGQTLASEAIIAAFGTSLATQTEVATALPLPTQLAGTTVQVRDSAGVTRLAPLFFVSGGQINYQIPEGTAAGTAIVTVTSGNGTVSTGALAIVSVAPGLFTANATGLGVAAAVALRVKADGTQLYEPVSQWDAGQQRYVSTPIDLGPEGEQVYLILFGTGLRFLSNLSAASATMGGSGIPVLFVGPQGEFVGLDQVNLGPVPRSLGGRGEVEIALTVDGKPANPVKINLR